MNNRFIFRLVMVSMVISSVLNIVLLILTIFHDRKVTNFFQNVTEENEAR